MTALVVAQPISTVIYSFYVESNSIGSTGLSPTITAMINVSNGQTVSNPPAITELSEGFYKFSYDWYSMHPDAYLLKIDTGLTTPAERFVTMRIEKADYLEHLADEIKSTAETIETSANSIESSASTIQTKVQRLLDIENGTWKIENNNLYIIAPDGTTELARFNLFAADGTTPTSTNPFFRVPVSIANS